jgi:sialate O-acetylesterase
MPTAVRIPHASLLATAVLASACASALASGAAGADATTPNPAPATATPAAPAAAGERIATPNPLFSDGCVLQLGRPVPVWGTGWPGATVGVGCAGQSATTTVGADGAWMVRLPALPAGGPYELVISPGTATAAAPAVVVKDVLVGEVWICAGQSNMEFATAWAANGDAEVKSATDAAIRILTVDHACVEQPQSAIAGGTWAPATAEHVGGFSAVGYFFARDLRARLHVPIGMISSVWGGTPAEAWTSRQTQLTDPALAAIAARDAQAHTPEALAKATAAYQADLARWQSFHKDGADLPDRQIDPGNRGAPQGWSGPNCDDHDWDTITLPVLMDASRQGAFWFRKTVDLPPGMTGHALELALGGVDDYDVTYVNGAMVGATGKETPEWWTVPRDYRIPAAVVGTSGKLVIAVRLFNDFGNGGLTGPAMRLRIPGHPEGELHLEGAWKFRTELALDPMQLQGAGRPQPPHFDQFSLGGLYNGMVHPLAPYALAGVVWYQGENNAGNGREYRALLPALIGDWRRTFAHDDLPFGIVQLANVWAPPDEPGASGFAQVREAQLQTAQRVAHTGLAVAIDLGEAKSIHPRDKQDVGHRLARWALAQVYHQPDVFSGPLYTGMTVEGDRIRLTFANATALAAKDGPLKRFAIAGADRHFVWADATIEGPTVVVHADAVKQPVAVRYAWADNPEGCNLVGDAGLPASPFRTDDWDDSAPPKP